MHPRTRRGGGGGTAELPSRLAAQQPGVLDASVEVSSAKVSTAAQPTIAAAAGGGVGRVDMSMEVGGGPGTRQIVTNYVDLANPHNLMPHLQKEETEELVKLVHQAFEDAQEACFYEFQPDVRTTHPLVHICLHRRAEARARAMLEHSSCLCRHMR
jgi:hypothetical protein|eukprot:COSAG01_NODE_5702_length_4087_cov_40.705617_1_plen_156_part_00